MKATGGSRNLNNKERHDWFPSVVIKAIKLRRMRWRNVQGREGNSGTEGRGLQTLSGGQILLCDSNTFWY